MKQSLRQFLIAISALAAALGQQAVAEELLWDLRISGDMIRQVVDQVGKSPKSDDPAAALANSLIPILGAEGIRVVGVARDGDPQYFIVLTTSATSNQLQQIAAPLLQPANTTAPTRNRPAAARVVGSQLLAAATDDLLQHPPIPLQLTVPESALTLTIDLEAMPNRAKPRAAALQGVRHASLSIQSAADQSWQCRCELATDGTEQAEQTLQIIGGLVGFLRLQVDKQPAVAAAAQAATISRDQDKVIVTFAVKPSLIALILTSRQNRPHESNLPDN